MSYRDLSAGEHRAGRYAIIGTRTERGFQHVGLLACEGLIRDGDHVSVYHMSMSGLELPPDPSTGEHVGSASDDLDEPMTANVVGWYRQEGLSDVQLRSLDIWRNKFRTWRKERVEFRFHPPFATEWDAERRVSKYLYSCTGFVVQCYLEGARITLIDGFYLLGPTETADGLPTAALDDAAVPEITVEELAALWGMTEDGLRQFLTRRNVPQGPPLRMLLPRHLFEACEMDCYPHRPNGCTCSSRPPTAEVTAQ